MIVGAATVAEEYGVLEKGPFGRAQLRKGKVEFDLVPTGRGQLTMVPVSPPYVRVCHLLQPFHMQKVRFRVWTDGFEPAFDVEGRVIHNVSGGAFEVDCGCWGTLPFNEPCHVQVEATDLFDEAALSATVRVFESVRRVGPRNRAKARLMAHVEGGDHAGTVEEAVEQGFLARIPLRWVGRHAIFRCPQNPRVAAVGRLDLRPSERESRWWIVADKAGGAQPLARLASTATGFLEGETDCRRTLAMLVLEDRP